MKIGLAIGLVLLAFVAPSAHAQLSRKALTQPPQRSAAGTESAAPTRTPDAAARGDEKGSTYYDLGVEYFLQGKGEQAVNAFTRAIQLNPNNADAHFNLGNAYLLLERWVNASAAYRRALELNPRDGEAHNNLGRAYYGLGSYEQAVEHFKHAIRHYPTWAEPHYRLSDAYFKLGNLPSATVSYEKAIILNPKHVARGVALMASHKPKVGDPTAAAPTAAVNKRDVKSTGVAATASATKPADTAAKPVEAKGRGAARAQPDAAAKVHYNQGVRHGRAKRFAEAIESFQQAVNLKPDYADAHFGLGHAFADAGRWRESMAAYEQVVRLNPKDEEAIFRLGEVYTKLRAEEAARGLSNGGPERATGERVGATDASAKLKVAAPPPNNLPAPAATRAADPGGNGDAAGTPTAPKSSPNPASAAAALAAAPAVDPTSIYRVGPGDVLDVRLLDAPAGQSTLYTVTAGGLLEYPLAGAPLVVAGTTVEEIAARIAAALERRALYQKPKVVVGVREYSSHNVIISGLVREPGTKVLRREAVPLYVVIADAQPNPEAEQAEVVFAADGRNAAFSLDDAAALNVLVRPGDVISVGTRPAQFFYISGEVGAPGQKKFHPGMTLTQAILAAGGKLSRGGTVRLLRQNGRGFLSTADFKLKDLTSGTLPDPPLQPNDRVEVLH